MYYVFSFRSRNESMRYYELLRSNGVQGRIISTPRAVSVGCGLSVQVQVSFIDSARAVLSRGGFNTFLGLFYFDGQGVRRID